MCVFDALYLFVQLNVVSHRVVWLQLSEIREVFERFDTDGSGAIDVTELRGAMKAFGQRMTHAEAEALMLELDDGGNGTIEYGEFVEFIKDKTFMLETQEEITVLFGAFAKAGSDQDKSLDQNDEDQGHYIT
jgi:centrin-1